MTTSLRVLAFAACCLAAADSVGLAQMPRAGEEKQEKLPDGAVRRFAERNLPWDGDGILTFVISPDGSLLAVPCQKEIWLWDVKTGKPLSPKLPTTLPSLAFSSDGKTLLTGCGIHGLIAYDYTTGRQLYTLVPEKPGRLYGFERLAIAPDARTALAEIGGKIHVFDLASKKEIPERLMRNEV